MNPWLDKLLELLFKMLEDCANTPQERLELVQSRPVLVWLSTRRATKELGIHKGKKLRQAQREACKDVRTQIDGASEDQLMAFCTGGMNAVLELDSDE